VAPCIIIFVLTHPLERTLEPPKRPFQRRNKVFNQTAFYQHKRQLPHPNGRARSGKHSPASKIIHKGLQMSH
jgi:hypothetical protein